MAWLLTGVVRTYQYLLSPHFGSQCRFTPTCSHYAIGALRKHGAFRGGYLTTRRVLRCHPWQPGGYDPVP
ncbi:MAG: membrane protein insertion efficiency factor YidD [Betaproteobacteria bacterium]|nr:membrane protein insertion efficiency factor YidD [Betaproteobacteria bacterium]